MENNMISEFSRREHPDVPTLLEVITIVVGLLIIMPFIYMSKAVSGNAGG